MKEVKASPVVEEDEQLDMSQHNIIFHDVIFEDDAEGELFYKIQQERYEASVKYEQDGFK